MTAQKVKSPMTSIKADVDVDTIIKRFGGPGDMSDAFLELGMIVRPATIGKWRAIRTIPLWAWFAVQHMQKSGALSGPPLNDVLVEGIEYKRKGREKYISFSGKPRRHNKAA